MGDLGWLASVSLMSCSLQSSVNLLGRFRLLLRLTDRRQLGVLGKRATGITRSEFRGLDPLARFRLGTINIRSHLFLGLHQLVGQHGELGRDLR